MVGMSPIVSPLEPTSGCRFFEVVKGVIAIMNFINSAIISHSINILGHKSDCSVSRTLLLLKLDPEKLS